MNPTAVKAFQKVVREWHKTHAPHFPWRETPNPYHILVSEVMLQQTQISRVLKKYPEFLLAFPTVVLLAGAPLRKVLKNWQGMGYNRRALYLKQAAEKIVAEHNSRIPRAIEKLEALPGIGPYSARAIACFAYNHCEPFIETNIRRAIIHEFFPRQKKVDDTDILKTLASIKPKRNNRQWYWALMDYGRDGLKGKPNPNRRSKRYTRQSKFEGSTRYIRARIIKLLLTRKKMTPASLLASLRKDPYIKKLSVQQYQQILWALQKEKLVRIDASFITAG